MKATSQHLITKKRKPHNYPFLEIQPIWHCFHTMSFMWKTDEAGIIYKQKYNY